jgi:hypothetical protein
MSTSILKIYGLQRTKTNYLQKFLELNYSNIIVLSNFSGWKHGFVKEAIDWSGSDWEETQDISKKYYYHNLKECMQKEKIINNAFVNKQTKYFFTFRDPYNTYLSRKKHYPDKLAFMKNFIHDWNSKNSHYLGFIQENHERVYKIRFEDFIDSKKNSIFLEIANHFDLQKKNNLFIDHKKRLDPRMRETNTRFVEPSSTRVSEFESAYFRDHLDMKVMNELNYEIQE